MKISAVIITKNEEDKIKNCLDSLKWVDEIIVVDSLSFDNTVKIALKKGAKVHRKEFRGYSEQKNFGIKKAKGDWILSIDADEIITEKLQKEILKAILSNDADGYYIPRKNIYYKTRKWLKFGGLYPDYQLRLFKKNKGKFVNKFVHEGVKVIGKTKKLNNPILHFTKNSIEEHIKFINEYTELESIERIQKNKKIRFSRGIEYFIKHYFLKLGFLDGMEGFIYHINSAMYKFIIEAKVYEKTKK